MSTPAEILQARGDAHIDAVNCYDRRLERICLIADYLFRAVIEDDHKTFPSEIVSAVAFLADEIHDSREEQAHIHEQLKTTESKLQRSKGGKS